MGTGPTVTAVIPVRDAAHFLVETLPALRAALPAGATVVVSDDGSRDRSIETALALGAEVVRDETPRGPAAARNRGAATAQGSLLVFVDADVRVAPDAIGRLLAALADPGVAAAFGSYDDAPAARSWPSLYKNLAHHFVHQRSGRDAATFWAGCGAIRRDAFLSLGGFDERYERPSIEDVELGYRLRAAGHRVVLVPEAQATHLKEWSLGSWLASDLRDRARPWAALVRAGRGLPRDLNFTPADRSATLCVAAAALLLPTIAWTGLGALACVSLLVAALALDAPLLRFLGRRFSPAFAAAAAGYQLAHRAAGLLGFAWGLLSPAPLQRAGSQPRRA